MPFWRAWARALSPFRRGGAARGGDDVGGTMGDGVAAANLGDSGLMVFRGGKLVFRTVRRASP